MLRWKWGKTRDEGKPRKRDEKRSGVERWAVSSSGIRYSAIEGGVCVTHRQDRSRQPGTHRRFAGSSSRGATPEQSWSTF